MPAPFVMAHIGSPVPPESVEATISGEGNVPGPTDHNPMTRLTELQPSVDAEGPKFGPGWEGSQGNQGHDPQHELTYTIRDMTGHTPDAFTGVHAFIPDDPSAVISSVGYQDSWGISLPNDRGVTSGTDVPWDFGISEPRVTADGY